MNIIARLYKITNNPIALNAGKRTSLYRAFVKWEITCFLPFIAVVILYTGMLSACAKSNTAKDTYLDPIPQSTLDAYRPVWPIQSELQAVIAARREVSAGTFAPAQEPRVLSVEKLSLEEARQRVEPSGNPSVEGRAGDTPVWLVFFDGYWQALSSDSTNTGNAVPPAYGCFLVVLDADEESESWVQQSPCPPCETSICLTPYPTFAP